VNRSEIDVLRREHRSEGIGPQIYAVLQEVVRATAVRYPPRIYGESSSWDEGTLSELLHEWTAERLLRGDLSMMLTSASSIEALRAQLGTSLKQLIINRRRRDSAGNLYRRTLAILKEDDRFVQAAPGSPHHASWAIAEDAEHTPSKLDLRSLVRVAFELSDDELEVVRYGPQSLKSSPILRKPQLERFLLHLLEGAGGSLTPTQIAQVMQHRFSLVREQQVALDAELRSPEMIELRIESDELAAAALAQLAEDEVARIRVLAENDWDPRVAASASEESEGALRATAVRLSALVAENADEEDQAIEVLGKVCESLFVQGAR
jgi:hypothetical protein